MPKTPPKANKSAFIRSLPADMSAADVIAKAKAANLKLTPAFVYAIRSKSRNKKAKPPGGAKRGRKPASGKPTASEFVRSQPTTMKAVEVVAAGAKTGLKFSTNLVYAVRSSGSRGGATKRGAQPKSAGSGTSEATLRRIALDVGIGRARQILDDLERKLRELIG